MRRTKKILTLFLVLISVALLLSPTASALNWNGTAVVGVGASNAQGKKGYTIRLIGGDGCFGYRFSVVDSAGATKTKSGYPSAIDVYRDLKLDSTMNYVYYNYSSASTKYNKKQLITNRNSVSLNMTAIKNQSNSYLASVMDFATTLPDPTGIGTWQANNNNLNKVLAKLGINGVSNFVYGDRLLVEPLFVMQMAGGNYNAMTITEIALYGAAFYGDSSSTGGASSSSGTWGYVANYTNMYFPRTLYTGDTNMLGSLWSVGSNLTSKTSFENIITKGYGVGIAYSNFSKVKVTLNKGKGINSVSGAGTYKVGDSVSINATLNDGYVWNKWTGSKASFIRDYTFTMPSSDVTNTANATPITYTIAHDPNGGGWAGDIDVDSRDYTIETPVYILTAPTRTGYSFNGWKVTSASGNWTSGKVYTVTGNAISLSGMYGNVTLTAEWTENKHTLKTKFYYMSSSGTSTSTDRSSTVSVLIPSVAVTPPTPSSTVTKNGRTYTFSHWSMTNSASGSKTTNYTASSDNHNYYAVYTSTVRITYNGNGNTGGSTSATTGTNKYNYDASSSTGVTLTAAANGFTRTGYTYQYWTVEKDAEAGYAVGTKLPLYGDLLLYAKWKPNTYTISYNKNTTAAVGNMPSADTKTYGVNYNIPNKTPTRTGYVFDHWETSATSSTSNWWFKYGYTYNSSSTPKKSPYLAANNNYTFYAQWKPISYQVRFNGNGNTSGSMNNQSFAYDVAKNLTANAYRREFTVTFNYNGSGAASTTAKATATFNGWAKTAGGSKVYNNKQNVVNLTSTNGAVVDLYAKWTDGTVALPSPSRPGYVPDGWNTKPDGSGDPISSPYRPTGNITIYIQWKPISYQVRFNGNGNTSGSMNNQSFAYDVAKNLTANAYRREFTVTFNYNGSGAASTTAKATATFNGWAKTAGGSKVYNNKQNVVNLTSTNGAVVDLYAKWSDGTVTLPSPSRPGYVPDGWNTKPDGSGDPISSPYRPTGNITIYIQWKPISYQVRFNGNGNTSGSMNNQSFAYDVAKNLTANAYRREFTVAYNYNGSGAANTTAKATATFNGWATSTSGSKVYNDKQSVKNLSSTAGAIVDLYAKWTDASVTLPTPTRKGYSFSGWYTAASGETKVGNGGATYKPTANITVYAHWSPISYVVKFNGNGNTSGSMSNQSFTYDTAQKLTANAFKREFIITYNFNGNGASNSTAKETAVFGGWATSATGSKSYDNQQSVKNLSSTAGATVNLYAKWTDGSVTLPTPTRKGYSFSGWFTAASGGTKVGNGGATYKPTANIILYARWSPITYSIKFNGNNATSGAMANIIMTYDTAKNLTDNAFRRSGYLFTGWNTKADGGGTNYTNKQSVKNLTAINGEVINLYAQWTPTSYTIKFSGNGATSGEMDDLNMTYDVARNLTANAFRKTGYAFKNWNTKLDGSGVSYADKQNVKNLPVSSGNTITMYAQWTPISYSVRYNGNGATSGTMNDQRMTYDVAANLTANAFKREFTVTYNYNYAGTENTSMKATASFGGWAKSVTGNKVYNNKQSVKNLTTTANATVNLYAKWTDGSVILPSPTRTGYTFNGWYTASTNGTRIGTGGGSYTPGSNVTVYAHWTPISYSVRYNGNGATSGTMIDQEMTYDTAANLTANAYKREFTVTYNYNYAGTENTTMKATASFGGWAKSTTGNKAYADKQSVKNLTSTANATVNLYARWADGTVILFSPVRTGYTFEGWYTSSTSGTKIGTGGGIYTPSGNITVYAHWTPINYTIRFNGNGSVAGSMNDLSMTYDKATNLTANTFTKSGAEFVKWNTKTDGSGTDYTDRQLVKNLTAVDGKVINLYAQWRSLRELSLEAISPNAAYRESTDVITSFNLVNSGITACLPENSVSVVFKVFKDTSVIKTVTLNNVIVPGNNKNLLYFKWSVPANLGNSKIYISAEIVENGESYGLIKNQYATIKYNVYSTPDTQYEASAPEGFVTPNAPGAVSEPATWSVWNYSSGSFSKVTYGIAISDAAAAITPDERAKAEQLDGVWVMKSGYGYGLSMNNGIKPLSGYAVAPSESYTKAQYALALFPEFGYAAAQNNCRTLELVSGKWNFRENDDYGRIHFTPLWYPDGPYTATVMQSDCWTPAGMISRETNTNTITISGSAYDDWYID